MCIRHLRVDQEVLGLVVGFIDLLVYRNNTYSYQIVLVILVLITIKPMLKVTIVKTRPFHNNSLEIVPGKI